MKVRILLEIADHVRGYAPDEVCDLDDDQAVRWVDAGWAEMAPETATLTAGEEQAVLPKGRKRG